MLYENKKMYLKYTQIKPSELHQKLTLRFHFEVSITLILKLNHTMHHCLT